MKSLEWDVEGSREGLSGGWAEEAARKSGWVKRNLTCSYFFCSLLSECIPPRWLTRSSSVLRFEVPGLGLQNWESGSPSYSLQYNVFFFFLHAMPRSPVSWLSWESNCRQWFKKERIWKNMFHELIPVEEYAMTEVVTTAKDAGKLKVHSSIW